jgi:hypothetical protein
MKYLRKYKIFESSEFIDFVNMQLISDLKDICLELLDDGLNLTYDVIAGDYVIFAGGRSGVVDEVPSGASDLLRSHVLRLNNIKRDFSKWTDFKTPYKEKIKNFLLNGGKPYYRFRIHIESFEVVEDVQMDVFTKITLLYPKEKIIHL